MTETLFALVIDWGAAGLALATFLSCLAVPIPTSLMMLAAGAFIGAGDLSAVTAFAAAYLGAVFGDQAGFGLGRIGGGAATRWFGRRPLGARLLAQAGAAVAAHGLSAVFLSRWLFSPLGPYVNLLAGAAGMGWPRFTAGSVAGEAVWVGGYLGLGFLFADQLAAVARVLGDSLGLLTSGLVAVLIGRGLRARLRRR